MTEFLNDMRGITDELALIQRPIDEEDLIVHILSQLGDEYNNIITAIKQTSSLTPWLVDSRALNHIALDRLSLQSFSEYGGPVISCWVMVC
ncbi:unnamed protein product [Lactuca saligna]|uniref:Uncharacterized protein n=1 Tax=Lactuca saligna TaxID=75948 RepID=A0AA35V7Y8_LACSI|nr:unnamed protein product [Lactuca saligna]